MSKKIVPAPDGLGEIGKATWKAYTKEYEFDLGELELLEALCFAKERLPLMRDDVKQLGQIVKGSMGQDVEHPLLKEIRATEAHIKSLVAALKLPDTQAGSVAELNQNREAGKSRWAAAYGKGA